MPDPATPRSRHVLEGVPRVGFYPDVRHLKPRRGPEDFIFPSCMRAAMEYLGHGEHDYIHFMGVTGAGFYLNWKDGWHDDNGALYFMAPYDEHLKLFQYAFDSTGYAMDFAAVKGPGGLDEAEVRRRILASIDAGKPVMAHGVVGPPETCLICGYDEAGDVLIGWSFFQSHPGVAEAIEREPNGMFRKRGWYADTWDLFALGERGEPADPKTVRRRSLAWASRVVRTRETWDGRTNNGLAAYEAWAGHLGHDDEIATDAAHCFGVHDDAVGVVAEGRWYASRYLARLAADEPKMAGRLYEAAACYAREHDLMWEVWKCCGGNGRSPEHVRRFADPDTRRQIVELIRKAQAEDAKAIEHIEAALAAVGTEP